MELLAACSGVGWRGKFRGMVRVRDIAAFVGRVSEVSLEPVVGERREGEGEVN